MFTSLYRNLALNSPFINAVRPFASLALKSTSLSRQYFTTFSFSVFTAFDKNKIH